MISSEAARLGEEAARRLVQAGGYEIGPGLTDAEFALIERKYEFEFADDHRAFLAAGLPLNIPPEQGRRRQPWPGWRHGRRGDLRERLDEPVEGALVDVEHNALWHPSWGQRPADMSRALRHIRRGNCVRHSWAGLRANPLNGRRHPPRRSLAAWIREQEGPPHERPATKPAASPIARP